MFELRLARLYDKLENIDIKEVEETIKNTKDATLWEDGTVESNRDAWSKKPCEIHEIKDGILIIETGEQRYNTDEFNPLTFVWMVTNPTEK